MEETGNSLVRNVVCSTGNREVIGCKQLPGHTGNVLWAVVVCQIFSYYYDSTFYSHRSGMGRRSSSIPLVEFVYFRLARSFVECLSSASFPDRINCGLFRLICVMLISQSLSTASQPKESVDRGKYENVFACLHILVVCR